jgi:hypothetical protein
MDRKENNIKRSITRIGTQLKWLKMWSKGVYLSWGLRIIKFLWRRRRLHTVSVQVWQPVCWFPSKDERIARHFGTFANKMSSTSFSTCVCLPARLPACLPACPPACPPACLPARLPACLPACPPARPTADRPTARPPARLPACNVLIRQPLDFYAIWHRKV